MQHSIRADRAAVATPSVIVTLIILVVAGIGIYSYNTSGTPVAKFNPIMAEVTQGEFVSRVLDQGEIESSANSEIRCEVKARNGQTTVISVVDEGTQVFPGDFLVQLDASAFEKELQEQNIAVANAETRVIQSETVLETAKAAKREYEEGIFVEAKQTIENEIFDAKSQITTAQQELEQSIAVVEHSKRLMSKGFITKRQLKADEFAVEKSRIAIEKARNLETLAMAKLKVLMEVTREKELTRLRADIRAAEVDLESQQKSMEVELAKLRDIQQMIARCRIVVPEGSEGQVVYAQEQRGRGGDSWVLEEGTTVRENQVLVRLPDPKRMQVKALINEQSITQIDIGMPVSVKVDALNNIELKGVVTKVNQYAESKGWFGSNIRKYAVFIKILSPPNSLKPGMNASVSIQSRMVEDAVMAPIQSVYSVQGRSFCLVQNGEDYQTREVEIDGDNAQMVLIKSGVEPGDQLVMNPGFYKDRMDLPDIELESGIDLPDNITPVAGKPDGEKRSSGSDKKSDSRRADSRSERGKKGGRQSGGRGGMADGIISKYDTDGNGQIDASELESISGRSKSFVGKADRDGDGNITKNELELLARNMMAKRGGGPGGPPAPTDHNQEASPGAAQ